MPASEIQQSLDLGAHILTANNRAARTLRNAHPRPYTILSLDAWATSLWHRLLVEAHTDRILLNPTQENAVWRDILASDAALAPMAADAWARLLLHNGRPRIRDLGISTDTRAFQTWATTFERRARRDAFISAAELPYRLQQAAERGLLPIPDAGLLLVGFDTIPPAWATLFDTLRNAGYPVRPHTPEPIATTGHLSRHPDESSEIRAAALFARDWLLEDPKAKIALVVPNLADRRPALDRILREILAPELEDIANPTDPPYEFSLGVPLADTPEVRTALDLLLWTRQPLPLETVSALLLSPWFGLSLEGQQPATAVFDAFHLRQSSMLRPELSLDRLIAILEDPKHHTHLPDLLARLRSLSQLGQTDPTAQRPYADWADTFRALLDAARWSRRAHADSLAYQTLQRWESTLDELATLDFDGTLVPAATALQALERIAAHAIFAPESQDAPVQVIGPLEAAGSPFDALWLLGAGELTWPPVPATSPFLPWHLQQELAMPGADATRDRATAQLLTQRLATSAPVVICSYAASIADAHQRPSGLLEDLALIPYESPTPQPPSRPLTLESVDDLPPPPFPTGEVTKGGAQILQLQAACAFRAFAERRLSASAIDSRDPGMDARERGNDVHNVMEIFWAEVVDQPTLKSLTPDQRHQILDRAIDTVLAHPGYHTAFTPWDTAYLHLQRQRLHQLLQPWLDYELERPEFSVLAQERKLEATLGGLRLSLRTDRIDRTAGGDLVLDYKTGHAAPSEWLSDRPDAPQLPLYALQLPPDQLGGVAFALLRAGDGLALTGLARDTGVLAKPVKTDIPLDTQIDDWRRVLTELAEDFASGQAQVDPKRYPNTCQHCAQRLLCRLNLTPTQLVDIEEAAEVMEAESDQPHA